MKFNYNTLKEAERSGQRVGNWNGKPVFACAQRNLDNKGSGAFYIVYDDGNKIVERTNGAMWWEFGYVTEQGSVNEKSQRVKYMVDSSSYTSNKKQEKYEEPKKKEVPTAPTHEPVVADVKLEIDVEATLRRAREMTIDDLLDGFNYGM